MRWEWGITKSQIKITKGIAILSMVLLYLS